MTPVDLIIQDRLQLLAPILQARFADAQLFLEVVLDPESDEQRLLVSVATAMPIEHALTTLHQFDSDWWLDNMDRSQGLVCIDTIHPPQGAGQASTPT
jgi:hypothetical protein